MAQPISRRSGNPLTRLVLRILRCFRKPVQVRIVLPNDPAYAPLIAYVADDSITFRRTTHC